MLHIRNIMNKRFLLISFIIILTLGIALRFYQLGSVPPSPDWDEVALAYDAHSLVLTGRDEFGKFLPPILRSFDDYKPAVYAYLAIPFVQLFDLTAFAVRLPSAIMGVIAIIATYFLVKELFVIRGHKDDKYGEWIALLAALSLAISPWHLQFSRIAFETNVGLTINILIALCFLKGLRKPWLLLLGAFLAGLNLSVYQSERVFTPLLVLSLSIIFRKELFVVQKKYLVGAVLAGLLAILPVAVFFMSDQNAFLRIKGTSIFNNQTEVLKKTIQRLEDDSANNDYLGLVFDNRRVVYANTIAEAYISHFDPNWLFMSGDINRHHAPRMGLLYIVFLPFVLLGIYQLLFGKYDRKSKYAIFSWFLLAPIPASITTGVPHAVRTLNFLPIYDIFIALGIITFVVFVIRSKYALVTKPIKYGILSAAGLLFLFNFVYYLNQYFVQQNYYYAYDWQYGYEKAVPIVEKMKDDYKKVIVSDSEPLDKSYMFFLFYLKYPPAEYQKIGVSSSGSFASAHYFDKYEFRKFDWNIEKGNNDVLYVGGPEDFPREIKANQIIFYPNGERAILIVDPKRNK